MRDDEAEDLVRRVLLPTRPASLDARVLVAAGAELRRRAQLKWIRRAVAAAAVAVLFVFVRGAVRDRSSTRLDVAGGGVIEPSADARFTLAEDRATLSLISGSAVLRAGSVLLAADFPGGRLASIDGEARVEVLPAETAMTRWNGKWAIPGGSVLGTAVTITLLAGAAVAEDGATEDVLRAPAELALWRPAEIQGRSIRLERQDPDSRPSPIVAREAEYTRKKNLDVLERLEADVADPAKLEAVRRMIPNLEMAARSGTNPDVEFAKRVEKIKSVLILNGLKKLVGEARAREVAAGSDLAAAAAAYDPAIAMFREQLVDSPKDEEATRLFNVLISRSDDLVGRLVTPEYEASVPVRDMLTPREAGTWANTEGSKFAARGSQMVVWGEKVVDNDGNERSIDRLVALSGWRPTDPWHDVVLDLEFTVLSGKFDLLLRYTRNSKSAPIIVDPTDPKSGYKLKTPHKMTIKIVGSRLELVGDGGPDAKRTDILAPDVSRLGGVAFALDPDSRVLISKCTVKVLRPHRDVR
jgi:hypothetical protein